MFKNRIRRRSRKTSLALGASVLALTVIVPLGAFADHPEVILPGSNFEIDTDANLKVDDAAPSIDWAGVAETRKAELFTGSQDESFGQGTKEDTAVPTVVDGGIPPNKSDLKFFGLYQEGTTTDGFLHLFWSRVQDPSGTTNMDFEFNHNKCDALDPDNSVCSANGVTPVRTAGDLLITYDLTKGGTVPDLSLREWTGSQWGPELDLTGKAVGSINSSTIPVDESDGLGKQDPRTFGEASIDLSAIFDDARCESFGSAYLKSRSSDSFTSALKDFVPPVPVDLSNCGSVKIVKTDDAGNPLDGAEFTLFVNNPPLAAPRGVEDPITDPALKCTTVAGTCTIEDVPQGQYWVVETVAPPNHDGAADQSVEVVADEQVTLTFRNPRRLGAILVTKTRKHAADGTGDHAHPGVGFTVDGGTAQETDANGQVCFGGLSFGEHIVHEVTPDGYKGEADRTVTVDNNASCSDDPFGGETVSFKNVPLSDITVSFNSQVEGGTA
ncbi:MAG TPA: SpaA isopeptide-forming pilin-related protein, partial [Acidimicrobiia bacterium]|nr:SpaA isopeptide-forming pilin-related protein [Acidimicrobiia bacterium]